MPDAAARFCAGCGEPLDTARAFVQEYWAADRQNFFCWCPACGQQCTVSYSERMISYEPEH